MRHLRGKLISLLLVYWVTLNGFSQQASVTDEGLNIGWAIADITPDQPVLIAGQFHARVSEGVMDPITATVLVIESVREGKKEQMVMVSCDLVSVSDGMRDASNFRGRVRDLAHDLVPELKREHIMLNATHTHAAPFVSETSVEKIYGVSLEMMSPNKEVMSPAAYSEFAAQKIAKAVSEAWIARKKGGISFGLSKAVIGHNRLQALKNGRSVMYGNTNSEEFSHIEGYENHDLNLLFTWNAQEQLTGVVVNTATPSQVSESSYLLSGDFWNETRQLFKERLGGEVHVLGQASAAGDQSPHLMWGSKAEERMQKLMGFEKEGTGRGSLGQRHLIATQLINGTEAILPYMKDNIEWNPLLVQRTEIISLSRRLLGEQDLIDARKEIEILKPSYEKMIADARSNPGQTNKPRWYRDLTISYVKYRRAVSVLERYELEKKQPKLPVEIQVIRLGDMAIASNPFELYVDYGIRMLAKSPAIQTFIVQLAGSGSYLPTERSIQGGAYGAVPASTIMGPEGGNELVDETLTIIHELWKE